jgi:predicted DNA-binding protein
MAREKLFNMRMSEDEQARLEALASHYALNAAGVIRMLIKREADRLVEAARLKP